MPREIGKKPRMIYPQIATSLSIAEVSMAAELLFWHILPQADDQGRLPGDPRQLKAISCPLRDELSIEKIPGLLDELSKAKLIIRYSNSSTEYIQITKWWDYQAGMRHAYPSQYPPPEGWRDQVKGAGVGKMGQNGAKCGPEPEEEAGTRIKESETGIIKPEPEEEGKTATTATETATESRTATDKESGLLSFLETLEGWRFGRADDLAWLREFCQEYPDFNLPLAKACRDYHSGKSPPKHKGHWKNRFREWMKHERQFQEERRGTHRQDTQRHTDYDWEEAPEPDDTS